MAYNPYSDIQAVYNAKVAWNKATTDAERQRQNNIATKARKNLEAYGYSDVANQISASGADATAARKIMEKYAPQPTTAPASTKLSNPELITTNNNEVRNKTNQLWGIQENDRKVMSGKYDRLEDTAYSNPFTTDEAKAILAKYDLSAMQGRDNAVASGGASNGGNIDSYAAANALRQQSALINQGYMTALDAHNNKINNVKGILESLGVYQQNQDKGMQNTITLQQGESQRLFENGETAKNNDVARKSEIASVTGYVPNEWTYENNQYLNKDRTVKDIYLTDEFDNAGGFETIINDAKSKLATTTDATERANLEATIYYAQQAKNIKTEQNPTKYGKYASSVRAVSPLKTATVLKDERDNDTVLKSLGIESADKRYEIDANNQNKIDVVNAETQGNKEILELNDKLGNNVSEEQLKTQIDTTISNWLYSPYKDVSGSAEIWKEGYETKYPQYIAAEKISDPDILASIKESLTNAGWDAEKKIKEYKRNIAIEIAKIEGKDYNNDAVLKSIYKRPGYKWVWDGKDS